MYTNWGGGGWFMSERSQGKQMGTNGEFNLQKILEMQTDL